MQRQGNEVAGHAGRQHRRCRLQTRPGDLHVRRFGNRRRMKRAWVAAALVVASAGGLRDAHAQTAQADVALVLAVDVSGSVDDIRFKLQREATAAALESDELAALSADVDRTVEV